MKNKKTLLAIVAAILIILLALGGGVAYLFLSGSGENQEDNGLEEVSYKELSADEVGLSFEVEPSGQAIVMKFDKLEGVDEIEYEAAYEREFSGEEGEGTLKDAAIGSIDIEGQSATERVYLGTCSATCTPHVVVSDVTFVIKVVFSDGEIGVVEETVSLE